MLFLILVHQTILNSFFAQESSLFPLGEYLNVSNVTNTDRYLCQQNNSSSKYCNCDSNCFLLKSCCIDKLWNNTDPMALDVYLEMFVNVSKSYKNLVCEQVMPAAIESGHKSEEVLMVHSCPDGTEKSDIELCINSNDKPVIENAPVMGSDKIIYRNSACARCNTAVPVAIEMSLECHNETENTTVMIIIAGEGTESATTTVVTNNTTTQTTVLKTINKSKVNEILERYQTCSVLLIRSNETKDHVVSCFSQDFVKDETCLKSSMHCDLCKKYEGTLSICNNSDCYNCNEIIKPIVLPKIVGSIPDIITWKKTMTLSTFYDPSTSCKGESFYDFLTNTCEPMNCCYGYTVVGSQCLEVQKTSPIKNIENASFENCLVSEKAGLFAYVDKINEVETINSYIYSYISPDRANAPFTYRNLTKSFLSQLNYTVNSKLLDFVYGSNKKYTGSGLLFITSEYYQLYTELYGFFVGRSFRENRLCAQPEEFTDIEGNFSSSCDYTTANGTIKNENLVLWVEVSNSGFKRKMSTCKQYHLKSSCVLQKLTAGYTVENQTLTYRYLNSEYTFHADQFVPLLKGVGVCKSSFLKSENRNLISDIENIIAVVLTSISIACYLLVIATYIYFKELRVISNFNLITLCSLLLLSDSTMLLSAKVTGKKTLCKYISVVLHWSLLTSYQWVLCMAVELAVKFSGLARKSSRRRYFTANVLISTLVPTLIVSLTVVLEFTGAAYIGYGNKYCWISGYYAKMFSYVAPLSVIFISCVVCLCFTIYKIRKLERANKKVLGDGKTSHVDLVMVALKLMLILGVTDAVGFIQIPNALSDGEKTFNSVFSLVYTCCRSSKGIMLLMVNILSKDIIRVQKRTLKLFSKRFHKSQWFSGEHSLVTFSSFSSEMKV